MFKKILIANRGEIALRIIRACKELGIKTALVYSEPDKDSLPVKMADESVCIGPSSSSESYLNIPNIISAAEVVGAEAIHPGYGFLAESTYFAEVCESCKISFIGPSKEAIASMGDKVEARRKMAKAGVPVAPGSEETIASMEEARKIIKKIKYPVIIKASGGGGGKGMRIVTNDEALENALATAQSEAKASFGNSEVYIEKYIEQPRHIEFQIMADKYGHVIYFPERNCSIQRRHQKLVEESPGLISEKLRKKMGKYACRAAEKVGYSTVGTVEFLLDRKDNFYFLEMNTRIQVEHPVTEMITGIDLVKEQILLASGEKMRYRQDDIKVCGHALECRINAEDSEKDFISSPGTITRFIPPGGIGVRVDTHIYSGYTILPFYDSLIAKIIVLGRTRQEAVTRMQRVLGETIIEGIKTTMPFHQKIMANPSFQKGEIYTDFIQKNILVKPE